ncbi:hypothetical protein D3C72_2321410 [compost metagenome]
MVLRRTLCRFALPFVLATAAWLPKLQNIRNLLVQALRYDTVGFVMRLLLGTAAFRFADRLGHGIGDPVAIQDRFTVEVTRRSANCLDQ